MHPVLVPIPEVGLALGGLGRTKVYEELASGRPRSVRVGRRRFVPADAIREYVEALEREAGLVSALEVGR
jgi:excisionase family DNA binding protein